jgi:iduronate 2-sulfatase
MPDEGPLPDDTARTLIHGYYAATSYADAQIGRLIAELDKTGFAKNTIIVLWGDHGWHLGDHGLWCKHTNYEQATHIPFMVIDPRAKSAGAHTTSLVESVDVYPTLCELAGLDVPHELEGKSFAKVISDPSTPTKDYIIHAYPRGKRIGRAVRTERYRLVEWKVPGESRDSADLELYDYKTDPLERKNLASEKPEVVQELRAILDIQPEAKPQLQVKAESQKEGNKKASGAKKQKKKAAA